MRDRVHAALTKFYEKVRADTMIGFYFAKSDLARLVERETEMTITFLNASTLNAASVNASIENVSIVNASIVKASADALSDQGQVPPSSGPAAQPVADRADAGVARRPDVGRPDVRRSDAHSSDVHREMQRVHAPFKIKPGHFDRRRVILVETLRETGFAEDVIARWLSHVDSLKAAVVQGRC